MQQRAIKTGRDCRKFSGSTSSTQFHYTIAISIVPGSVPTFLNCQNTDPPMPPLVMAPICSKMREMRVLALFFGTFSKFFQRSTIQMLLIRMAPLKSKELLLDSHCDAEIECNFQQEYSKNNQRSVFRCQHNCIAFECMAFCTIGCCLNIAVCLSFFLRGPNIRTSK